MFCQEPDLGFVRANDVAHQKIVSAVIASFVRSVGALTSLPQDDLVCFEQAGQLGRHVLAAPWRPRDLRHFVNIGSHSDADAAESHDALCNQIDQRGLLLVMLVQQKVQLVNVAPDICQ